jgi:MFS family permease
LLHLDDWVLWLLAASVALVVGLLCVIAYAYAEEVVPPLGIILAAPFVASPVSAVTAGGLAMLFGTSFPWAAGLFAIPLAIIGFGGGCGVSLAQLLQLFLQWRRRRAAVAFEFPDPDSSQQTAEHRGDRRIEAPPGAFVSRDGCIPADARRPPPPVRRDPEPD